MNIFFAHLIRTESIFLILSFFLWFSSSFRSFSFLARYKRMTVLAIGPHFCSMVRIVLRIDIHFVSIQRIWLRKRRRGHQQLMINVDTIDILIWWKKWSWFGLLLRLWSWWLFLEWTIRVRIMYWSLSRLNCTAQFLIVFILISVYTFEIIILSLIFSHIKLILKRFLMNFLFLSLFFFFQHFLSDKLYFFINAFYSINLMCTYAWHRICIWVRRFFKHKRRIYWSWSR